MEFPEESLPVQPDDGKQHDKETPVDDCALPLFYLPGSSGILQYAGGNKGDNNQLTEQYKEAGEDGQRIFVLNMLPDLVDKIVSTVNGVSIDRVAVVDSGLAANNGGGGIPAVVAQLPGAVVSLSEQIEAATGVDILSSMRDDTPDDDASALPPPPPPVDDA